MCLLGIDFQRFPGVPLLILANREEAYARPATGPQWHPPRGGAPAWLGGIDLVAGGTWLGVNAHGLVAAVTNRRRAVVPAEPRSRGLLCRSLLAFKTVDAAARAALEQLQQGPFAGCNLLIATTEEATVIEFADELRQTNLSPGRHWLTNGPLNDPADNRIARARQQLEAAHPDTPKGWIAAAQRVCALGRTSEQPPICLEGTERGTVSSTILELASVPEESRYWHAPGPPVKTPYADWTPLFRRLLTETRAAAVGHRIQLRGPWHFELLARNAPATDSSSPSPDRDKTHFGTLQFPAHWTDLGTMWPARVRLRRRFHRPNNLEKHERVYVVLEEVCGTGTVSVNGSLLGAIDRETCAFRAEATHLLRGNDELVVELETAEPRSPALFWRTAALQIVDERE